MSHSTNANYAWLPHIGIVNDTMVAALISGAPQLFICNAGQESLGLCSQESRAHRQDAAF